ncbi:MAG: nucleoside hydrolase [Cyclobacteriaceae bacterium]|nr:nucleoside hydrolase [Cyclobacteriaceae bacterium]
MTAKTYIIPLFALLIISFYPVISQQTKTKVIIDADTGNEVDDLFAISRALIAPEFEILGLNSAQWQNSHWAEGNTLENSQRINERILSYLHKDNIPHPRGSQARLYDWGQDVAQHSAAAYHIINTAKSIPDNEKLTVIALGALTNVASALLIAPEIAPRMKLYCLGTSYNFDDKYWKKTDFNCLMDPHAINVVLDNKELEVHIVPVNIAVDMKMDRETLVKNFKGKDDLRGFLYDRWMNHMDGGYHERIIWDLSVVYMVLNPKWVRVDEIQTPPENTRRKIYVAKSIEGQKMTKDFFESMTNRFK